MDNRPFAMVRCAPVTDLADLAGLERHGQGRGPRARKSRRYDGPRAIARSFISESKNPTPYIVNAGKTDDATLLTDSLKAFMESHDASFYNRSNAAKCLNLIVGISPAWIEDGLEEAQKEARKAGVKESDLPTDARDPRVNKRLGKLFFAANKWAEQAFGGGLPCVFASRLDLDEAGAGNVDLYIAPLRPNKRSGKLFVSTGKAREDLAATHGIPNAKSYSAMQTDWHAFACEELGHDFQRGAPVVATNRQHLTASTLREIAQDVAPELVRRNEELEEALERQRLYALDLERQIDDRQRADSRQPAYAR